MTKTDAPGRHASSVVLVARAALSVCAAFAIGVAAPSALAAQTPITTSTPVRGGQPLASPLAGITVTLPDGFAGGWDTEAMGLVLESPTGMILGAWGWSEGTIEEVADAIDQQLTGLGLQLQPREGAEMTETELTGVFDAYSSEGRGVLNAAIRRGEEGNVFAVAILGGPGSEAELQRHMDRTLTSLRLTTPGAATWRAEVEGAVLRWSSSGSDMSTGTTTATGASSSEAYLSLCPAGMYRYSESSETYVSIEGMSASNSSEDGHAGQWWISADLAGQALLTLESSDGRVFHWSVEETGAEDAFLVDGYRYVLSGSC